MARILFVEDNDDYRETMVKILRDEGYEVDSVSNPIEGIEHCAMYHYHLVIADLKMEFMDGVQFLKSAQKIIPNIKTILLTANPDSETELEALEINVDYYISKDKTISVILGYVKKAISEGSGRYSTEKLRSAAEAIIMHGATREVYKDDKLISLTNKEYQLLELFLKNKGIVLSREEIIHQLWGGDLDVADERVVDVHVWNLRKKLNILSIISVRGYGYKWNE